MTACRRQQRAIMIRTQGHGSVVTSLLRGPPVRGPRRGQHGMFTIVMLLLCKAETTHSDMLCTCRPDRTVDEPKRAFSHNPAGPDRKACSTPRRECRRLHWCPVAHGAPFFRRPPADESAPMPKNILLLKRLYLRKLKLQNFNTPCGSKFC